MSLLEELRAELVATGSLVKAKASARFFKTAPGQYGDGDQFIGVTVPELRHLAAKFRDLPLTASEQLLLSPIHEERLIALIILVNHFHLGDNAARQNLYHLYLANTAQVNNWDLVDSSAEYIVGAWLADKERSILMELARSGLIWDRRIAMLATFHFIKQGDSTDALRVAEMLLHDQHDLIQKAVGWMLREVGKRCSQEIEEQFLTRHYQTMPRTMLRYAIERFPQERRGQYLKGLV